MQPDRTTRKKQHLPPRWASNDQPPRMAVIVELGVDAEGATVAKARVDEASTTFDLYPHAGWLPAPGDQVTLIGNSDDPVASTARRLVAGSMESGEGYDLMADHGWGFTDTGDFYANNAYIRGIIEASIFQSAASGQRIRLAEEAGVWGLRFYDASGTEESFLELWENGIWLGFKDLSGMLRVASLGPGNTQVSLTGDVLNLDATAGINLAPGDGDDADGAVTINGQTVLRPTAKFFRLTTGISCSALVNTAMPHQSTAWVTDVPGSTTECVTYVNSTVGYRPNIAGRWQVGFSGYFGATNVAPYQVRAGFRSSVFSGDRDYGASMSIQSTTARNPVTAVDTFTFDGLSDTILPWMMQTSGSSRSAFFYGLTFQYLGT